MACTWIATVVGPEICSLFAGPGGALHVQVAQAHILYEYVNTQHYYRTGSSGGQRKRYTQPRHHAFFLPLKKAGDLCTRICNCVHLFLF